MSAADDVRDWEARGRRFDLDGRSVWMLDVAALDDRGLDPLLVLHGFPSCSFDWRHVLDALRAHRRVVAVDFLGFGLSDKPDVRYSMRLQADVVEGGRARARARRRSRCSRTTWATPSAASCSPAVSKARCRSRSRDACSPTAASTSTWRTSRPASSCCCRSTMPRPNSSQADGFKAGLAGTFSPNSAVDDDELDAQWLFAERNDGHRLLPRTIRYIEDRRAEERRFTGAIETHPSPLAVVWGADDPIAVVAMTDTLLLARPDAQVTILDGVGHYPMIESPTRFATAVTASL